MEKVVIELPAMYGDHHVTEVRRILKQLAGVQEVNASSAFQIVEVTYDPAQINDLEIRLKLDEAGYLGEWSVLPEPATHTQESLARSKRHTAVYEQTRQVVGFKQQVPVQGRPLWPCPGFGAIRGMDEEV